LAAQRAANADGTLPFIMGQIMVFKREALDAIGGVECATGQLVDDMYIGKCVHEAGYRNVIVTRGLKVPTGGLSFAEFLPIYRRWMAFSRNGLPMSFTWPQWALGGGFYAALIATVAALLSSTPAAALAPLGALAMFSGSLLALNQLYGGARIPLKYWWTPVALMSVAPYVMVKMLTKKHVAWRGRSYQVGASAALAPAPEPSPSLRPAA
jgi:ceramide glucosyltransferase